MRPISNFKNYGNLIDNEIDFGIVSIYKRCTFTNSAIFAEQTNNTIKIKNPLC